MDEKGFQQVLKGGDRAAMEAFIRHIDGKGEELHLFVLKKGQGIPVRKSEIVWKTIAKTIFETTVAGFRGKVNKVDEGEIRIATANSKFFVFFVCVWCALASERRLLTMLGAKVRDDQQLAKYAQSLLGQNF